MHCPTATESEVTSKVHIIPNDGKIMKYVHARVSCNGYCSSLLGRYIICTRQNMLLVPFMGICTHSLKVSRCTLGGKSKDDTALVNTSIKAGATVPGLK